MAELAEAHAASEFEKYRIVNNLPDSAPPREPIPVMSLSLRNRPVYLGRSPTSFSGREHLLGPMWKRRTVATASRTSSPRCR
jgi:hypothetical protein